MFIFVSFCYHLLTFFFPSVTLIAEIITEQPSACKIHYFFVCICWSCICFGIVLCRLVEYACTSLSLLAARCVCVCVCVCVRVRVWAPGLFSAWAGPSATKPSLSWPISKAPHTHTYVHMVATSHLSCLSETIRHAHTHTFPHTHSATACLWWGHVCWFSGCVLFVCAHVSVNVYPDSCKRYWASACVLVWSVSQWKCTLSHVSPHTPEIQEE